MLLTFPAMRAVGTSMLASAGLLGIVAGIAAQSTLGNLFAGLQIAFGDMVRIGDTVVVDGEWGTVEEITLTFLTVRTWDERRITMPVSYFTSKPFENWSRGGAQMTGTVFFHLDHARAGGEDAPAAAGDPAGVRRVGRPVLEPGGHRHHPDHDRGARRWSPPGTRTTLWTLRCERARADARVAAGRAPLRAAADQHRRRRPTRQPRDSNGHGEPQPEPAQGCRPSTR